MLILLILVAIAILIREHTLKIKEVRKVEAIEQKLERLEIELRVNQAFNEDKLDKLISNIKEVKKDVQKKTREE